MGKKKPLFGVNTYIRRTRKKRPGRHAKSVSKRVPNKSKISWSRPINMICSFFMKNDINTTGGFLYAIIKTL